MKNRQKEWDKKPTHLYVNKRSACGRSIVVTVMKLTQVKDEVTCSLCNKIIENKDAEALAAIKKAEDHLKMLLERQEMAAMMGIKLRMRAILAGNSSEYRGYVSSIPPEQGWQALYISRADRARPHKFDDIKIIGSFWEREDATRIYEETKRNLRQEVSK